MVKDKKCFHHSAQILDPRYRILDPQFSMLFRDVTFSSFLSLLAAARLLTV